MGFFKTLLGRNKETRTAELAAAQISNEHYSLKCVYCPFVHDIPSVFSDEQLKYSVDPENVKMSCVYGRRFTVTLEVREFFTIKSAPASGLRVLQASIGPNMRALHAHMLSHCDPLFLIIRQSPDMTSHEYAKGPPEGETPYVRFTKDRGIDIFGTINIAKAEIPGVSD